MKPIARRRLSSLMERETVRVWTIQHPGALAAARRRGRLEGDAAYAFAQDDGGRFEAAYEWMCCQMARRLPVWTGTLPIWAWPNRPNLRSEARPGRWPAGALLVTADVPRARCLFSDFELWHSVLNDQPLALDEASWDALTDRGASDRDVEGAWDAIFGFGAGGDPSWLGRLDRRRVQVVVDTVRLDEIRRLRPLRPLDRRREKRMETSLVDDDGTII
jgi:hypothetical protein